MSTILESLFGDSMLDSHSIRSSWNWEGIGEVRARGFRRYEASKFRVKCTELEC
jgi:hypothetical protein